MAHKHKNVHELIVKLNLNLKNKSLQGTENIRNAQQFFYDDSSIFRPRAKTKILNFNYFQFFMEYIYSELNT